jgi:hypothetical protein
LPSQESAFVGYFSFHLLWCKWFIDRQPLLSYLSTAQITMLFLPCEQCKDKPKFLYNALATMGFGALSAIVCKNCCYKKKVMGVRLVWKRILWAASPTKNPKGPLKGKYKVIRGGSWINYAVGTRHADRTDAKPGKRLIFFGFCCVK